MGTRLRRYARLVRSPWFLGRLLPPLLTLVAALLVLFMGVCDGPLGLRGETHDAATAAATFGEPGAPPLWPWERLGVDGRFAGLTDAPPPETDLLPGVRGTEYVTQCSTDPRARHERNPKPVDNVTLHTSEENAGAAGVDAVCRYHSRTLGWGRAGYHYYVSQTGRLYQTLDLTTLAYAQKADNPGSITVVLQGSANRNVPSDAQLDTLRVLWPALAARYGLGPDDLLDHATWSARDQALLRAGRWTRAAELVNDHTDVGSSFKADGWGLRQLVRPAGAPSGTRALPGLGAFRVPDLPVRSRFNGTVTYYEPTGRPAASGLPYDGNAHTGASWLLTDDQLPADDPRRRDCHDSPTYGAVICPAFPWQTVVRVCRQDRPAACTRVSLIDTGEMKSNELDLSPVAFRELGALREGRIAVTVTVVGYLRP